MGFLNYLQLLCWGRKMKIIEIIGENYFGHYDRIRAGCRGIVIKDGKILLSYETKKDTWMIPGGGSEDGEDDRACCIREISEETGSVVDLSPCVLEIDEYYEDVKYISRYFFGVIVGETERKLTPAEIEGGLEPVWTSVRKAEKIFSRHASYSQTDEMKRGLYLREYTALKNLADDLHDRIVSFEKIALTVSGMRGSTIYEIVAKNGRAEASEYRIRCRGGKYERLLEKRSSCSLERALKFLNDVQLLSWDGFDGKHPKGVLDGVMFRLEALVNGSVNLRAQGSQNFPKYYREFTDSLYDILKDGELEIHIPAPEDGWFYFKMMSDPATMAYNAPWFPPDGLIPEPEKEWEELQKNWIGHEPDRFYAFLKRISDGAFVGDINYHSDTKNDRCDMGIVIYAPERGKGYGSSGLRLLADKALRIDGVKRLHNEFETTREAGYRAHKAAGFRDAGTENGMNHLELTREDYLSGIE